MMAFSTFCYRKLERGAPQLLRGPALALALGLQLAVAWAQGIHIKSAELTPSDTGYSLEANYEITLPHALEEALVRGLVLPFVIDFDLTYQRWWTLNLWNRAVARTLAFERSA